MSSTGTYLKSIAKFVMLVVVLFLPLVLQAQLPDIPDLIVVTVDHSDNGVVIRWEPSSDTDIESYFLFKKIGNSFVELFTFNATTFEFRHTTSGLINLAYAVVAEDTLGNRSVFSDNVQQAVAVSTEFDICTQSNLVQWTPYLGWEGNISGYRVFGGLAGASMQELTFVPASINSYSHTGVEADRDYTYYIETVNTNGISSLSPIDTVTTTFPEAPSYLTIDHVTVLDPSTVEIQYSADLAGPVTSFRLFRRSNPDTPFTEVDTRWNVMESTQVVQDQFQTGSITYQYMVESLFMPVPCNTPIKISESNTGNSILLVNTLNDLIVTLNWTAYKSYEPGLAGYIIQRNTGDGVFVDIETVDPLTTQWSDVDIQSLRNGYQQGEIQYRVIALSNPNGGGNEEQSMSNPTSVVIETHVQLPSAFIPGSIPPDDEFKPLMDFAPKDYILMVADRGGRKMFETTDPGEGWDGRFNGGDFVNEGVYVYYIEYTDYTGLFKNFMGNVTVLYP